MFSVVVSVFFFGVLLTGAAAQDVRQIWNEPNRRPQPGGWESTPIVELGRHLFFDTALSGSGRTACASCHDPRLAYSDPRPVSVLDTGYPGRRNAPSLVNVWYRPRLTWDGRFESLEQQAFDPFKPDGEMGIGIEGAVDRISRDPGYASHFFSAFGRPPSPEGVATALAAFERTLVRANSRFDRFVAYRDSAALSPMERRGWEYFTGKAGCVNCHIVFAPGTPSFPLFSDSGFHNEGVGFGPGGFLDPGRAGVTFADIDCGAFRTPSLRNVAVTGPYMHNGSLRTLYEVISFYNAGGGQSPNRSPKLRPLGLNEYEKEALIAFLLSLTDQDYQ